MEFKKEDDNDEFIDASPTVPALRVLLWCPYGIVMSGGGAGINARRLYQAAQRHQVHVTVAHGLDVHPEIEGFSEFVKIGRLSKPSRVMEHLVFLYRSWLWIKNNIHNYDIFHGIDAFEATVSPASWAKRLGVPVIIKPASQSSIAKSKSWRRVFNRSDFRARAMAKMDAIVAISEDIGKDLFQRGIPEDRILKIPNGVDCHRYFPANKIERESLRESLGMPEDVFCILFVAGLRPVKRIEWGLEALKILTDRGCNARLYLVGNQRDMVYRDFLMESVMTLGLSERVIFVGEVDDTTSYYQAADAFCLTSKYEGMPNALLEAMACGQCSFVTPVSGSRDIIEDGVDGYFVTSPLKLADRLETLVSDVSIGREVGKAARLKAHDYSLEDVWEKYFEQMRRIASSQMGARR